MSKQSMDLARQQKNDEFYTQLDDISKEILGGGYNLKDFEGKTILSNCDDPYESNFTLFFILKFRELKLKRFISTCYKGSPIAIGGLFKRITPQNNGYVLDITEKDLPPDDKMDGKTIIKYLEKNKCIKNLKGDGDFRSEECLAYLKEADIVITNPPFSLFREYIAKLMEYEKKFLILGNSNAITYKEVFPLIKEEKLWLGCGSNMSLVYKTPYKNNLEANAEFVKQKGYNPDEGYVKVPACNWYTNLDLKRRHEKLILYKSYEENKENYPKYENYNAINIDKIADIPKDYNGILGVPITILGCINPNQFKIISFRKGADGKDLYYTKKGERISPYFRVLVQKIDKEDK